MTERSYTSLHNFFCEDEELCGVKPFPMGLYHPRDFREKALMFAFRGKIPYAGAPLARLSVTPQSRRFFLQS
jgi:hypothetical protein